MMKRITCRKCGEGDPITEIDREEGWDVLKVEGWARRDLKCDRCDRDLFKGSNVVAITITKEKLRGGLEGWETDFIELKGQRHGG